MRAEKLIELVWADEAPANGVKSLQVLVSRVRNACGADIIVRDSAGYRLGAAPGEVDSVRLSGLVRDAAAALDRDAAAAALAREALALTDGLSGESDGDSDALAQVRRAADADGTAARLILALFQDGFTLEAAEAVLGVGAVEAAGERQPASGPVDREPAEHIQPGGQRKSTALS